MSCFHHHGITNMDCDCRSNPAGVIDAIPGDIYTVWDHLLQSGDVCGVQNVPKRLVQGFGQRGLKTFRVGAMRGWTLCITISIVYPFYLAYAIILYSTRCNRKRKRHVLVDAE